MCGKMARKFEKAKAYEGRLKLLSTDEWTCQLFEEIQSNSHTVLSLARHMF